MVAQVGGQGDIPESFDFLRPLDLALPLALPLAFAVFLAFSIGSSSESDSLSITTGRFEAARRGRLDGRGVEAGAAGSSFASPAPAVLGEAAAMNRTVSSATSKPPLSPSSYVILCLPESDWNAVTMPANQASSPDHHTSTRLPTISSRAEAGTAPAALGAWDGGGEDAGGDGSSRGCWVGGGRLAPRLAAEAGGGGVATAGAACGDAAGTRDVVFGVGRLALADLGVEAGEPADVLFALVLPAALLGLPLLPPAALPKKENSVFWADMMHRCAASQGGGTQQTSHSSTLSGFRRCCARCSRQFSRGSKF